jgi:hypothetical protein
MWVTFRIDFAENFAFPLVLRFPKDNPALKSSTLDP